MSDVKTVAWRCWEAEHERAERLAAENLRLIDANDAVQARSERLEAALRELVAMRDLVGQMNAMALGERIKSDAYLALERDYLARTKPAWAAARALLDSPAPQAHNPRKD